MSDIFTACRESVTARQVAEHYGFEFRKDRINCPFHGGKNYNLAFYGGGFKCFVCDESGDSITFIKELYNLSPLEAAKKLNIDFGLGLNIGESNIKADYKPDVFVKQKMVHP